MIECQELSKSYGSVVAVSGVNLRIEPGRVTGLLGPNGAGKSTLIRMIASYLLPNTGRVSICGFDTVTQSQAARGQIGYLPESAPAYPEMPVRDYLRFKAGLYGITGASRKDIVENAVRRCWLSEMAHKRIGELSKGYRQRVGLAAAILHDPAVIVLDEPTTGLDPSQILELRSLIAELAKPASGAGQAAGRVVLLSSHILAEVEATCDRVIIMAGGRVRAHGTPAELIASQGHVRYRVMVCDVDGDGGAELMACADRIRRIAGVATVSIVSAGSAGSVGSLSGDGQPGRGGLLIEPRAGAGDLSKAVALAVRPLLATELRRIEPTLEEVFLSVVTGIGPAAGVASGGALSAAQEVAR